MPRIEPDAVLRPHLAPAERLEWSSSAGPVASGGVERFLGFVFAGSLAVIVTVLAGVEQLLPGLALPVLFIAVFLLSLYASKAFARRAGSRPRAYGITDRRVLVHAEGALQSYGPDDLAALRIDRRPDGTVDLYWGWTEPAGLDRRYGDSEGRNPTKFHVRRRTERIGFVGLESEEPARTLIGQIVQRHHDAAAIAAAPAPSIPLDDSMSHTVSNAPTGPAASTVAKVPAATPPDSGWHTVREPHSGLAIDLPDAWQSRVGLLARRRVLGVVIESPEPKWFDSAGAGWNRLEVKPALDSAVLQVDLDPPSPPADLAAVVNDKWSKLANVTLLEEHPDLRFGDLAGFGVTQSLKGAGIGAGGIRIGGSIKADLLQTQVWLRGAGLSVHLILVCPREAAALREAMERAARTLRLE
ncbi:MAG: hypothetical protein OZ935_19530 [Pseudomonadota bacterium]|nr:hypothetical protein [Pseudomonadota bacterium]